MKKTMLFLAVAFLLPHFAYSGVEVSESSKAELGAIFEGGKQDGIKPPRRMHRRGLDLMDSILDDEDLKRGRSVVKQHLYYRVRDREKYIRHEANRGASKGTMEGFGVGHIVGVSTLLIGGIAGAWPWFLLGLAAWPIGAVIGHCVGKSSAKSKASRVGTTLYETRYVRNPYK